MEEKIYTTQQEIKIRVCEELKKKKKIHPTNKQADDSNSSQQKTYKQAVNILNNVYHPHPLIMQIKTTLRFHLL